MTSERRPGPRWYELAYAALLLILLGVGLWAVKKPRVGVLDLVEVAKELGVEARMSEDDQQWRGDTLARIRAVTDKHHVDRKAIDERVAKAVGDAEKTKLREERQELDKRMQETIDTQRRELQRHREDVAKTFRQRIQPIVDDVARRRRLDVALDLTRGSTTVLYSSHRVSITEEVIMQARPFFPADQPLGSSPRGPGAGLPLPVLELTNMTVRGATKPGMPAPVFELTNMTTRGTTRQQ